MHLILSSKSYCNTTHNLNDEEIQRDATVSRYLLLNYSTHFGRPSRPAPEVHKTVIAASGTDHTI